MTSLSFSFPKFSLGKVMFQNVSTVLGLVAQAVPRLVISCTFPVQIAGSGLHYGHISTRRAQTLLCGSDTRICQIRTCQVCTFDLHSTRRFEAPPVVQDSGNFGRIHTHVQLRYVLEELANFSPMCVVVQKSGCSMPDRVCGNCTCCILWSNLSALEFGLYRRILRRI